MKPLAFYNSSAWRRKARKQALHDAGWQCQRCHTSLANKGKGAHVHHRKEYRKAPGLAVEPLNLMALCVSCHDAVHAEMKKPRSACDELGRPTDPRHPWNKPKSVGGCRATLNTFRAASGPCVARIISG